MILVTGGTGLVGAHLLLELTKSGYKVRALKRSSSNLDYVSMVFKEYADNPEELLHMIKWVDGDVLDILSLEDAMTGIEKVYHVAAIVSFQEKEKHIMMKTNIEGTVNVVNIALDKKVRKLCYVSSIAALGRTDNNAVIDENTKWVTSRENSSYGISKFVAEKEVWRGMEEGLGVVIVNPSVILGLANPERGSTQLFQTVWKGLKIYASGINGFVDVKDVARAMIALMESKVNGERFILNGGNLAYKDLFWQVADLYHKPRPDIRIGKTIGELAWRIMKLWSMISRQKPIVTKSTARTGTREYRYSNEKIKKYLDFNFTDLHTTIHETAFVVKKYYLN